MYRVSQIYYISFDKFFDQFEINFSLTKMFKYHFQAIEQRILYELNLQENQNE